MDAITLTRSLAELAAEGVSDVIMEVSSHALDQGRVDDMRFQQALFTNLSRDHLDYHHSMEAYAASKKKLLLRTELTSRILNLDDPTARTWSQEKVLRDGKTYGISCSQRADLWASNIKYHDKRFSFNLNSTKLSRPCHLSLLGRFNLSNALLAAASLMQRGIAIEDIANALPLLKAPPGRMMSVYERPCIVIDYAHTPDALDHAIAALRYTDNSKPLWVVFGAGGDRDQGKRPQMGDAAGKADAVVVTSDNPRNENPQAIIDDILQSSQLRAHPQHWCIADRGEAIAYAIQQAPLEAYVLIAGKGHEKSQIIQGVNYQFDDAEVAIEAATRRSG